MKIKPIKAWAVLDKEGNIPTGIYREEGIYRIYRTRKEAISAKFEMFEKQFTIPVTITPKKGLQDAKR